MPRNFAKRQRPRPTHTFVGLLTMRIWDTRVGPLMMSNAGIDVLLGGLILTFMLCVGVWCGHERFK